MARLRFFLCIVLAATGLTLGAMISPPVQADGAQIPERFCPMSNRPAKWVPGPIGGRHPSPCPPLDPPIAAIE